MSAKDDLLRQADHDFGALKRALVGLSDDAMRQPWSGVWGVREILAHIAGWHREMIPMLERLARGEKPLPDGVSYADVDGWNARHVAARRGLTVEGVRAELDASHRAFLVAAARRPRVAVRAGQDGDAHRRPQRPSSLSGSHGPHPRLAPTGPRLGPRLPPGDSWDSVQPRVRGAFAPRGRLA